MKIKIIKDEIIYEGRFFRTIKRHYIDTNGKPNSWDMVQRKTYGRIVAIAAITENKELILEKIFRIPCNSYVIELPAGLMDIKGELEETAIRRELLEETGYVVDKVKLVLEGPFDTGLVNDTMAIYLGMNARLLQKPQLEGSEDIEIIKVPAIIPFLQKHDLLI